jgi:hypothetical protein
MKKSVMALSRKRIGIEKPAKGVGRRRGKMAAAAQRGGSEISTS